MEAAEGLRASQGGGRHPAVPGRLTTGVLVVLLALVWGFHWVVAKKGLEYMPPFTYAALRVVTGLVTVLVLVGARRRLVRPTRRDLPIILSIGVLQVAAGAALMNLALQVVPAGRSSILVYTMPIWVAVIQAVFFRIAPVPIELAGLVLGFAGILLLVNPAAVDWSAEGEVVGAALLLLSAIIWAATSIHIRHHRWRTSPLDLQPWQLLAAAIPLVALALLVEGGRTVRWEPATVAVLLYSGPLATAFAFWASQSITRSLGPLAATVAFLGVPVVGLASGALVLGEPLTVIDLAGFSLTALGILLVTRPRPAAVATPPAARPPAVAAAPAAAGWPEIARPSDIARSTTVPAATGRPAAEQGPGRQPPGTPDAPAASGGRGVEAGGRLHEGVE